MSEEWTELVNRVEALLLAEDQTARDKKLSQRERLAHKATRDAYQTVLGIISEITTGEQP